MIGCDYGNAGERGRVGYKKDENRYNAIHSDNGSQCECHKSDGGTEERSEDPCAVVDTENVNAGEEVSHILKGRTHRCQGKREIWATGNIWH